MLKLILILRDLYKKIYIGIPNQLRNEFREKLDKENLSRLNAFALIIISLSPFAFLAHYLIYKNGYCENNLKYCGLLFTSHHLGIGFSFLLLILNKIILKNKLLPSPLILLFILIYFILFASSSLSSQYNNGNIVFFSTGSVLLASLFVTFKRYSTVFYPLFLIFFVTLMYFIQKDNETFILNSLNSILCIFLAYTLNLVLFHYKLQDFIKSKKLESTTFEQNKTLNLIKKDISVAKKIQSNLVQKSFDCSQNCIFEIGYFPLEEIGGDIYDIYELNKKQIRIFLADATGHGIQAALITMLIKSEYESLKHEHSHPKKLLKELNHNFSTKYSSLNSFFSCVIVDIFPLKDKLIFASAGHPDQILQKKNWEIQTLQRTGKLVGVSKDSEYEEVEISFEQNDKLFLFTDGLFEVFNKEKVEFGEEKIISAIKAYSDKEIKEVFSEIMKDLEQFAGRENLQDDISFIGVEHA